VTIPATVPVVMPHWMVILAVTVPKEAGIEYDAPPPSQPVGTDWTPIEPGPNGTSGIVYWPLPFEEPLSGEPSSGLTVMLALGMAVPVVLVMVPVRVPVEAAVRLSFALLQAAASEAREATRVPRYRGRICLYPDRVYLHSSIRVSLLSKGSAITPSTTVVYGKTLGSRLCY
jgi:hypothetical protein